MTGLPLESEEELAGMCLKLMVKSNLIIVTGYGNRAVYNCTLHGDGREQKDACHATQNSTYPEMAEKAGITESIKYYKYKLNIT